MTKKSLRIGLVAIPRVISYYSNLIYPSLALAHLSSYLSRKGYDVKTVPLEIALMADKQIYDYLAGLNGKSHKNLAELASKENHLPIDNLLNQLNIGSYDLLGFSCSLNRESNFFVFIIARIKKLFPNVKIVLGGLSRFKFKYEEYIRSKLIDFIVVGNGEEPLESLITALQEGNSPEHIGRIIYFDGSKLVDNSQAEYRPDLSSQSIFFDMDYMDRFRLFSFNNNGLNNFFSTTLIPYLFSEGCPYKCAFCTKSLSDYFFYKTPESIVSELSSIKETTGIRYFAFLDDEIGVSKEFLEELCDRLIKANLDILWIASIRASPFITQELFHKMRKSGCICLDFGCESGSDRVLKNINKGLTAKSMEECLRRSHQAGIWNSLNIIVCLPTETEDDFQQTLDFVSRNNNYVDWWATNPFILFPSAIYNNPVSFGISIRPITPEIQYKEEVPYDEIDGLKFEELSILKKKRLDMLRRAIDDGSYKSRFKEYMIYNELLFPLYDHFNLKEKVVDFIKKNYPILSKGSGEFFSIPLGVASNQREKGNIFPCRLKDISCLPAAYIAQRMELANKEGFRKLIIHGGEPLIHPKILDILGHARKLGFYIILKSNARMLKYENLCADIAKLADELLVISHADNAEKYDAISGVPGSFEQAKQGMENWKKLGKKLNYYC